MINLKFQIILNILIRKIILKMYKVIMLNNQKKMLFKTKMINQIFLITLNILILKIILKNK